MKHTRFYAVLTGDIIKSSQLLPNQLDSVRQSLERAIDVINVWQRGLISGSPGFFRGDAWQLLLTDPARAMRVGIFLRASLRTQGVADTRIAIGLGEVERIYPGKVSLSTGQAFKISGRALDAMTQYSNLTIEIPDSSGPMRRWLPVVGHLCDSLISQWTQRQAEVVCSAVDPHDPTHEVIANGLRPPVTKQAVTKVLDGAKWHVIREAIHEFEEMPWSSVLNTHGDRQPE